MNASRREFLRGSLVGLGLLLAPVAAMPKPLKKSSFRGVEFLVDPEFNIQALVERDLGESFAKMQEAHFINGDGFIEPIGITSVRESDGGFIVTAKLEGEISREIIKIGRPMDFSIGYEVKR